VGYLTWGRELFTFGFDPRVPKKEITLQRFGEITRSLVSLKRGVATHHSGHAAGNLYLCVQDRVFGPPFEEEKRADPWAWDFFRLGEGGTAHKHSVVVDAADGSDRETDVLGTMHSISILEHGATNLSCVMTVSRLDRKWHMSVVSFGAAGRNRMRMVDKVDVPYSKGALDGRSTHMLPITNKEYLLVGPSWTAWQGATLPLPEAGAVTMGLLAPSEDRTYLKLQELFSIKYEQYMPDRLQALE